MFRLADLKSSRQILGTTCFAPSNQLYTRVTHFGTGLTGLPMSHHSHARLHVILGADNLQKILLNRLLELVNFLLQLLSFVSELMDLKLTGKDQRGADQPNNLEAEGPMQINQLIIQ